MNAVLSAAGGWVVALAIAVPIIILFWWARRNAPVGDYELDYSVGRRARPPLDNLTPLPAPAAHGLVDAPVLANPAVLAPPTEAAAAPASIVALPAQAPLPPEPAQVLIPAPVKPAEPAAAHTAVATPAPTALPAATAEAPKPVPAAAPKPAAPAPVKAAEAAPKPKPAAPPPAPKPEMEKPAPEPEAPKPTPAPVAAAPTSAAEPTGESDDFTRLYGPNAAAIAALHAAGIVTYRQLAAASIDGLKEILANGGASGVDPSTWPQQGRFAAGGKWKQLDARFKG